MPKSTTFSNDVLKLILNGTAIANIADNAAASPITNLYVSYHTADPGIGGSQTTNEATYTNYARVAIARTSGGWTVVSNSASNTALAQFAICGVTGNTLTHVAVGTAASGAGKVLWAGSLSSTLAVSTNIQPQFSAGALVIQES